MIPDGHCYREFLSYWKNINNLDPLSKRLYLDIMTSLPEDMLTKVDRVTMAVSLEARVPLLDYRIVELSSLIPAHMKMSIRKSKRFMKNAVADHLPQEIINRPKHGFSSPIDKWMRYDLKEMVDQTLNEKSLKDSGFFKPTYITQLFERHTTGKGNFGEKLFMLMVFQMWWERFVKVQP
jgi:asparagine synthase (glutamine-hydrolysing)